MASDHPTLSGKVRSTTQISKWGDRKDKRGVSSSQTSASWGVPEKLEFRAEIDMVGGKTVSRYCWPKHIRLKGQLITSG
jgi:hypothetical protein